MRTITLEEHFASPGFLDGPGQGLKEQALKFGGPASKLFEQLCDLGDGRVAEMDAARIDMQILSLTSPGAEQLESIEAATFARETNDYLANALRSHPTRFGGFATLPTADPSAAADELERTIRDYGFKGAVINGHVRGRYLDDEFFWPIFKRAEALDVPIYLHPTQPPKPVIEASYSGFAPIVTDMFSGAGWGWHIETAIHVIRIILGGTFDRYPGLQLVVGHMGETLPFMLQRLDVMAMVMTKLGRAISAYLRENIHYTFSGFNFTATFLDLLLQVGVDRIMFRPTIRMRRWLKRVRSWTSCRLATLTGDGSHTAMRNDFWACKKKFWPRAPAEGARRTYISAQDLQIHSVCPAMEAPFR